MKLASDIPSSRQAAIAGGHKRYFTGLPCKSGHVAQRYASGVCTACGLENSEKYRRKYPQRIKASFKSCMSKEASIERRRAWVQSNRDSIKEKARAWGAANRDRKNEVAQRWRDANRDVVRAAAKRARQKDPARECAKVVRRQAAKISATPRWLSEQHHAEMRSIYQQASATSAFFGVKFHVDHAVPLRGVDVCGLHVPWNLQVIPALENHRKSNRL